MIVGGEEEGEIHESACFWFGQLGTWSKRKRTLLQQGKIGHNEQV